MQKKIVQRTKQIMKKRMSVSSYRIYQTSFSMYQYSLKRSKALFGIVILIAFMLTMLTGLVVNVQANWNKSQIRLLGSDAKLVVKIADDKLLEKLYAQRQVENVGLLYPVKQVGEFSVCYADATCWEFVFLPAIGDVKGDYPKEKKQIMVSQGFLAENGYQLCEIGDEIAIKGMGTFEISGVFTDYSQAVGVRNLYVSKEYAKGENRLQKKDRKAMLTSDLEQYYFKQIVELECDIPSEDISFLEYQSVDRDRTVVLLKWILFFLFVCGGISIYHVFYTVVSADQKFYGLFAVIGMSRQHIYDCMKWQSSFVAVPGILAGVTLGMVGQIALVPWFMKKFLGANEKVKEYLVTEVELYPVIPLLAAMIIVGMVFAGFCMVAHRISKLSPMECLKKSGTINENKHRNKKQTGKRKNGKATLRNSNRSVFNLAWQNQKALIRTNLLMGISLFVSNQFFLVVWAISQYYKEVESVGGNILQKAGSISILGYFIGIVVLCTEIIRLFSVSFIRLQTRKKQLDLLCQIGMTKKQLKEMLTIEGLIQYVYALLVAVLLEGPFWIVVSWFMQENGVEKTAFPFGLWMIILIIDFVVFICSVRKGERNE